MKLLVKTSLWYIAATTLILLVSGTIFHFFLNNLLDEEASEILIAEKNKVINYIHTHQSIPVSQLTLGDEIQFNPVAGPFPQTLEDIEAQNPLEDELSPYRQITFPVKANMQYYSVQIRRPLFEQDDLFEGVLEMLLILAVGLLVAIFLMNQLLFKRLLKPFYDTMAELKRFRSDQQETLVTSPSSIYEWKQLNESLLSLTEEVRRDYQNLKAFSENAAHELQTPLAVIRNNSEMLMQTEKITGEQAGLMDEILHAAYRLSRINQSLLLLAKIENKQYQQTTEVNLSEVLRERLEFYADKIENQEQELTTAIADDIILNFHPELAASMMFNLIDNAIRHSPSHSQIQIVLTAQYFEVSNTGAPLKSDGDKIFQRFYKESQRPDSTGLGLAIVKSITDEWHMRLTHRYEAGKHVFRIDF